MTTILAIDQGTTSTKAFLLSQDGTFRPLGSIPHRQILPAPGHVEHDASEILSAIETLIDRALDTSPDLTAIALANQGETVVAWDRDTGQPLHNAIVWQDQRTQARLDAFPEAARALIQSRAGLPVDAYFSASKLAWLVQQPAVARAAQNGTLGLGTSDSFFLHRLTGTYATDVTTASRTSLMHLGTCRWDTDLCSLFGIPLTLLPDIRPSTANFGTLKRNGREVPLAASLVDQQAALFGHGCRHPGEAKITFGTGSFALALTGPVPLMDRPGLVPTVAWQRRNAAPLYALDAGDYTAAAAVDWALSLGLGTSLDDFTFADPTPAITKDLAIVPALAGLAAPHWRRDARAAILGMTQSTTAADLRKALLEGIAFRGADLIDALCGPGETAISIDGGLTANPYFVQFLSNALARPVRLHASADLTALGAALMAFDALGLPDPQPDTTTRLIPPDESAPAIQQGRAYFQLAVRLTLDLGSHRP